MQRSQTNSWNIVLYWPPANMDLMVFSEIARLLYHSLKSLGYSCQLSVNQFSKNKINIMLGYHLTTQPYLFEKYEIIIYQLEQLSLSKGILNDTRKQILALASQVWDYSEQNIKLMNEIGIQNTELLPIGYHPCLETIGTAEEDIDILFYGSMNERRKKIIEELARQCRVEYLFRVYGPERDHYIRRSKIILNLHYYEMQIMEQARISYLLNNRQFIISENSDVNPYEDAILCVDYDDLVSTCMSYLNDTQGREEYANKGYNYFNQQPMSRLMHKVTQSYLTQGKKVA